MRKLAILLAAVLAIELCCPATAFAQTATYAVEETADEAEILEESNEEVVEETLEESTEEVDEETLEESTEEAVEETLEESTEEVDEETLEESTEEVAEETLEESTEEVVEETLEESTEEVAEETLEESTEVVAEETLEESAEEATEETEDELSEEFISKIQNATEVTSKTVDGMIITVYDNGYMTVTGEHTDSWADFELSADIKERVTEIYCDFTAFDGDNFAYLFDGFRNVKTITFGENFVNSTGKVIEMSNMFKDCTSLSSLDISDWDVGRVTRMEQMFYNCTSLTTLQANNWNAGNVKDMSFMFDECTALTSLSISGWNTSSVTDMSGMFKDCTSLKSLNINDWNVSKVTDMSSMFSGCTVLTTLDLSKWNLGAGELAYMFYNCQALTTLNVSSWDTGEITGMTGMFMDCSSLTTLDVSKWDTGNVTYMYGMFSGCNDLTTLDVSGWNTDKVTNMSYMFADCGKLTTLQLNEWNTGKVTDMSHMFNNCTAMETLDISNWNTGNVTDMSSMFSGCESLTALDLSSWDISKVTEMDGIFYGDNKLHLLKTPVNNTISYDFDNAVFCEFKDGIIDTTSSYKEISVGMTTSLSLIRPDNHDWSKQIEQEDGTILNICSICGIRQAQTGVKLLLQENYYNTKSGYPLFAVFVIPKDTISGSSFTLESLTLAVDDGKEKELTVGKSTVQRYYLGNNSSTYAGYTLGFNAGYDKTISAGEHTLTYKAVINNGTESFEVSVSKKAQFIDDLASKECVIPLKSTENTQYMSSLKGNYVKMIYHRVGSFQSSSEKFKTMKFRNHETKKEVPVKIVSKKQEYGSSKIADTRYGTFVEEELGVTVYGTEIIPKDAYGGWSDISIQLTEDIPVGIYDVVYVSTTGREYIFEERYEATDKTVVFEVRDTVTAAKSSTDEGIMNAVPVYADNSGNYVSIFVYGLNLNKNNIPIFYNNGKTAAITEYDTKDSLCGIEEWEYGFDFSVRKNDSSAGEWVTESHIPVKVSGDVIYTEHPWTNEPAEGSEDGFITSYYRESPAYRHEYNIHDKYVRYYLSPEYVKAGDKIEVTPWNKYPLFGDPEYVFEAVVQDNGIEHYIEFLSDTQFYQKYNEMSWGAYIRKKGETEYFSVSNYWEPGATIADNITVPANCRWEIHPAKDVGNVIYSGSTTTKKKVLNVSQVNNLAGKGAFRICIYNANGKAIDGGKYLTYFGGSPAYKIEYVLNGGENNPDNPAEYASEQAVTLAAPAKYGYVFGGWYSDAKLTKKVTKIAKGSKGDKTFYAKWTLSKYSIVYNANGGSGSVKATSCKFDTEATVAVNKFKKKGYVFEEWNTKKDGTGTAYKENEKVLNLTAENSDKIQLYAIWRPVTYTVILDKNASDAMFGEITEADVAVDYSYEDEIVLSGKEYERTGYTLSSWNKKANGKGTKYVFGKPYKKLTATDGTDVTLYAVWTRNTYKITYNLDGGKIKGANPKKYYVDSATIVLKEPTKAGFTFEGWYETDEEGNFIGEKITKIEKGSHENLELTAKWAPMSYEVELYPNTDKYVSDENQGTIKESYDCSQKVSPADWSALYEPMEEWKNKGYGIMYWSTKPNGTGKKFYDNKTYSALATSGTVKLYAKWGMKKYAITYENTEGVRNTNPASYTYDATKKITLKNITKKGYTFEGWYTDESFAEGTKVAELNRNVCKNITLYAKLTPISYTVKLAPNGNNVIANENLKDSFVVNYDESFTLTEDSYTREHYRIAYWATNSKGTGKKIKNGSISNLTTKDKATITLYPKWELVTYTISYENVDYEKVTNKSPKSYKYNAKKDVSLKNPTRPGYAFGGWFTEDTTAESFNVKTAKRITKIAKGTGGDLHLYALWTPIQYKIQLVANAKDAVSGSVTIGSAQEVMNIAYGDAVTFATDSYKRKGYVLTGFSTNKNGKGTKYALNEAQYVLSTKANKTIKLYAVWEKVKTVKVSDVTISSAAGEIVVRFAPNADCNTYEISYSPTIMMRDAKMLTVSAENADNAIISDVEAGMRYYVRVREVRYDSCGNAITGKWSTLRTTIVAE